MGEDDFWRMVARVLAVGKRRMVRRVALRAAVENNMFINEVEWSGWCCLLEIDRDYYRRDVVEGCS